VAKDQGDFGPWWSPKIIMFVHGLEHHVSHFYWPNMWYFDVIFDNT
jgi:hypothetical protein